MFEDLQCPDCRRAAPLLAEAGRTYKIPVVRHDFPLPMHNWSMQAAVFARYFDTKSKTVGNEFRDYIFEHQLEINPDNLRGFAEKFAAKRKSICLSWWIQMENSQLSLMPIKTWVRASA